MGLPYKYVVQVPQTSLRLKIFMPKPQRLVSAQIVAPQIQVYCNLVAPEQFASIKFAQGNYKSSFVQVEQLHNYTLPTQADRIILLSSCNSSNQVITCKDK